MVNKLLKRLFLLLLFLMTHQGFAQQGGYVVGQLLDSITKEPVAFASIRIKNKALGIISNIDGSFKIPLRYKAYGDIIEISSMGYQSMDILMEELEKLQHNTITLKPGVMQLEEAIVSANIEKLTAKQIVRIAVNSIAQNYPMESFGMVGYYRDYQIKEGNYINLNEAIIKVFDEGFETKDNFDAKYQVYSYDKNPEFEVDSFAKQPYDYTGLNKIIPNATLYNTGGNEFVTLSIHDAIRNYGKKSFSFINDISSDFIDDHRFRLRKKTTYGNQVVYEINLVHRNDKYLAEGKIFINEDNFAIHKLDYAVFKRKRPNAPKIVANHEEKYSNGFKKLGREILYRIQIEYAMGTSKKMFLNYISFYNKFLVKRPADFKSKFVIDLDDRYFRIRLNKVPKNVKRIRNKDFKISYKDEKLPISAFYFLEDERTFVVCPDFKGETLTSAYKYLFTETDSLRVSDITYAYGNIKDSLGNKLDYRKLEYMHQYREFFAQEIKPSGDEVPKNSRLMIKMEPLDSRVQPIYSAKMKNGYWKNTPLPTLKK